MGNSTEKKGSSPLNTRSSLGGLAAGFYPGRALAKHTANIASPRGEKTKAQDLAHKAAILGSPLGGLVALALARRYNLPGRAEIKHIARYGHGGAIIDGRAERALLESVIPLAVGVGGSMAGGALTGGLVAEGAHLKQRYEKMRKGAGMPFTEQNRPKKVKDIFKALKRDHPNMSAEEKARIAARQGKPGKQKQGPPYSAPISEDGDKKASFSPMAQRALIGAGIGGVSGAGLGAAAADKKKRKKGALVGGLVGATGGGLIGAGSGRKIGPRSPYIGPGRQLRDGKVIKVALNNGTKLSAAPNTVRAGLAAAGGLLGGAVGGALQYRKSRDTGGKESSEEMYRRHQVEALSGGTGKVRELKRRYAQLQLAQARKNKDNPRKAALLASLPASLAGAGVGFLTGKALTP